MKREKIKIGMKVVPHSKTAEGRFTGLENSAVWKRALRDNQHYLYVISILDNDYVEYILSDIKNSHGDGDYFLSSDFESYDTILRKKKLEKLKKI